MKKFVAVFLCTLMAFLTTACTPSPAKEGETLSQEQLKNKTEQYAQDFESTANIKYNGLEITATIQKKHSGETIVSFSSPETLKGLNFTVKEDDIKVNYMGMDFHIDPNNLNSSMMVSMMIGVFNNLANNQGISAKIENNAILITGDTNDMQFEMTLDKTNGNALSLNIPSMGLSAEFE